MAKKEMWADAARRLVSLTDNGQGYSSALELRADLEVCSKPLGTVPQWRKRLATARSVLQRMLEEAERARSARRAAKYSPEARKARERKAAARVAADRARGAELKGGARRAS